jgi:peptide/nickel transport system substrate-binding protein
MLNVGMVAPFVSAQDETGVGSEATSEATPGISSITRAEWDTQLQQLFPFTKAENEGGTVVLGDNTDIQTTNGLLANDTPSLNLLGLVFETLTVPDPTTGNPVPGLADSWDLAADGITYTFHINKQAKWQDGVDVTADDVAFSFKMQSNAKTGSAYTGTFTNAVKSWKVLDPDTIQVTATGVLADFLTDAYCPIMPEHLWKNVPADKWAGDSGSNGEDPNRVIGTGPFKFKEWVKGDHVTLEANKDYYGQVPHIDRFIFQVWPDDSAGVEALRSGDIDIYQNIPAPDTEAVKETNGLDVAVYPTFGYGFLAYNMDPEKTELFQDVRVRQALFYALDRQSIVNDIYLGYGEVANGSQPLLSFAYAPDEVKTIYNYDPAKAKELLDDAGWVDSDGDGIRDKDGQKFSFDLSYPSGTPTTDQLVAYMQQAWKAIGVEMNPEAMEFQALIDAVSETFDYDVALLALDWDVTGNQAALFNCDQYKVGFNIMKYCNPKVDKLNNEARHTLDPVKRRELLIKAMNITNDDLPVAVILFRDDRTGYNDRLQNFYPNGISLLWSLPYVWVKG